MNPFTLPLRFATTVGVLGREAIWAILCAPTKLDHYREAPADGAEQLAEREAEEEVGEPHELPPLVVSDMRFGNGVQYNMGEDFYLGPKFGPCPKCGGSYEVGAPCLSCEADEDRERTDRLIEEQFPAGYPSWLRDMATSAVTWGRDCGVSEEQIREWMTDSTDYFAGAAASLADGGLATPGPCSVAPSVREDKQPGCSAQEPAGPQPQTAPVDFPGAGAGPAEVSGGLQPLSPSAGRPTSDLLNEAADALEAAQIADHPQRWYALIGQLRSCAAGFRFAENIYTTPSK